MIKLVQSFGFAIGLGALLYAGTIAFLWPRYVPPDLPAAVAKAKEPPRKVPSWDYSNPDIEQLIQDLQQERAALAERSRQLDELATRLQSERNELNVVTQAVHQLRLELDRTILRIEDEETANLKKLAKVYATMTPDGAAGILTQLDETAIVKILTFMKESETAPILETISRLGDDQAKLAAAISERLRLALYRKAPEKSKS